MEDDQMHLKAILSYECLHFPEIGIWIDPISERSHIKKYSWE